MYDKAETDISWEHLYEVIKNLDEPIDVFLGSQFLRSCLQTYRISRVLPSKLLCHTPDILSLDFLAYGPVSYLIIPRIRK